MARLKELSGYERDEREKYYIEIMNDYSANNMEKLRKLINHSIKRFGKNQDNEDYDEFLSMANMQLWKILLSFDPEKNDNIQMYIKAKMCLKMRQTETYCNREKRKQYARDEKGKIIRDEKGRPNFIYDKRLDDVNEKGQSFIETVSSNFDVHKEAFKEKEYEDKVEKYLNRLSILQKKIVYLMIEGFQKKEILEKLNISDKEYINNIGVIRAYENKKILLG